MDRKNVVFMTCMDGAPDILDYKNGVSNHGTIGVKKIM